MQLAYLSRCASMSADCPHASRRSSACGASSLTSPHPGTALATPVLKSLPSTTAPAKLHLPHMLKAVSVRPLVRHGIILPAPYQDHQLGAHESQVVLASGHAGPMSSGSVREQRSVCGTFPEGQVALRRARGESDLGGVPSQCWEGGGRSLRPAPGARRGAAARHARGRSAHGRSASPLQRPAGRPETPLEALRHSTLANPGSSASRAAPALLCLQAACKACTGPQCASDARIRAFSIRNGPLPKMVHFNPRAFDMSF